MKTWQIVQSHARANFNAPSERKPGHHRSNYVLKSFSNEILPFIFLRQVRMNSTSQSREHVIWRFVGHPSVKSFPNDRSEFRILSRFWKIASDIRRSLPLVCSAATRDNTSCEVLHSFAKKPIDLFS